MTQTQNQSKMKYGTPKFTNLTDERANWIQNNKINSRFELSFSELDTFITVESLTSSFVEIPPINLHSLEMIQDALSLIDGSKLIGRLQYMYLTTYFYGGRVLFRKSELEDTCEILYLFTNEPVSSLLNRTNPSLTIDGEIGHRAVWLLKFVSSESPFLTPSITLNITIDAQEYLNKSVSLMTSLMQPQAQVGIINKLYSGFGEMKISLIYNNDDIDNNIFIVYH
jgi:hypothetical protein